MEDLVGALDAIDKSQKYQCYILLSKESCKQSFVLYTAYTIWPGTPRKKAAVRQSPWSSLAHWTSHDLYSP